MEADPFEDLYNHAPCGYLVLTAERIASANSTAAAWLSCERSELVNRGLNDILPLASRVYWETHLRPLLKIQSRIDGVALDFLTSTGAVLATFVTAIEVNGQTRLAFFRASQRRQFEQSLLTARLAAIEEGRKVQENLSREREMAALREQFIAVLGHDLRNPLAGFVGGLRIIAKEDLSERAVKVVSLLTGSAARMSELIDNILDLARTRLGGGIALKLADEVPLDGILTQVAEELRIAHPEQTIETTLDITKPVRCDPGRIAQLVSNLLANAIAHGAPDQPVKLIAEQRADAVEISIVNGGNPIPPEIIPMLFHPFVRGTVQSSQQGLGLGLHIASEIAKAHGGTLDVASDERATCFSFRMLSAGAPGGH